MRHRRHVAILSQSPLEPRHALEPDREWTDLRCAGLGCGRRHSRLLASAVKSYDVVLVGSAMTPPVVVIADEITVADGMLTFLMTDGRIVTTFAPGTWCGISVKEFAGAGQELIDLSGY